MVKPLVRTWMPAWEGFRSINATRERGCEKRDHYSEEHYADALNIAAH
jgi:hypothetical protein